jgi:hypothetical protein
MFKFNTQSLKGNTELYIQVYAVAFFFSSYSKVYYNANTAIRNSGPAVEKLSWVVLISPSPFYLLCCPTVGDTTETNLSRRF